jgi:hypothetical protein
MSNLKGLAAPSNHEQHLLRLVTASTTRWNRAKQRPTNFAYWVNEICNDFQSLQAARTILQVCYANSSCHGTTREDK